ncbi:MAG: urease accessory protein UreE [Clostridium sp.]|nr:urease accessory protein UreE [Clostridium sp.]
MIFNEIVGNINDISNLDGYHVETIYLNSEDLLKRILRVTSDHNREYGISLEKNEELKDGDLLYNTDKKLIVVKVNCEDVLVIKPSSMEEMGTIAHALGNRHMQAQFEENTMIVQYDRLVEEELKKDNIAYSRENKKLKKAFRHVEFSHTH